MRGDDTAHDVGPSVLAWVRAVALGLAVPSLGGWAIGRLGALQTVLLALLAYSVALLIDRALGDNKPGVASRSVRVVRSGLAIACLLIGAPLGLIAARIRLEPSLAFATRGVVFDPLVLIGLALGGWVVWLRLRRR